MSTKIVVSGNPNGQFNAVLTKLATLHAKNNFALAVILGDLFSKPEGQGNDNDEDIQKIIRGEVKVPLPTYFTLGTQSLPEAIQKRIVENNNEVCENLFYIGKRATLSTSEGVKLVALGGRLDTNLTGPSKEQSLPFYSEQDAATLKGANYADLLLTYEIPEGVIVGEEKDGVKALAILADGLRPKYHFTCGGERFYEREPYKNAKREKEGPDAPELVSRFIALADYGNASKSKWMYAFNLNIKEQAITQPQNTSASPYSALNNKKRLHDSATSNSNFFWGEQPRHNEHQGHHGRKRGRHHDRPPPPGPESCFFCLSNPNLAKHLITSIGSESYITTAKGPLTTSSTNAPQLDFPGHVLIMPFAHSPTLNSIDEEESRTNTIAEMNRYKSALEKMYEAHNCGTVVFEVVRRAGIHTHWQVIPIAKSKMSDVATAFVEASKAEEGCEEALLREASDEEPGDYFRVWMYDADGSGKESSALLIPLKERVRFDLQFGRKVLASVLGVPDRIHWKDCYQTVDEEMVDANAFKTAFKDFDFSLEE